MPVKIRVNGGNKQEPEPDKKKVKVKVQSSNPKPTEEASITQVPEGTRFTLYAPTDTVKKGNKTIRVKGKNIHGVGSNEEIINTPIEYLNSYYNSEEFKKRSGSDYEVNRSFAKKGADVYKPEYVKDDPKGSHAVPAKVLLQARMYDEKGEPTVFYDTNQPQKQGLDLENEIKPHEYSHTTRHLYSDTESKFVDKNKANIVRSMYNHYQNDPEGLRSGKSFSQWYYPIGNHTGIPDENYADLNTLRWNMYRQGIYDARKGPMTMDHLKKAMEDPALKNNKLFKRLFEAFKPEDIVELNNTIAMNNNNTTNTNNA